MRTIAFHLPQYHPIPENNEWWGPGFTEWTNVTRARPRFPGHYQPHIPADLGFYDLRVPETRAVQAELARRYLVDGFCYYHYWFNSRRLLERPVTDILRTGEPDFPFMLCWANENWTRRWDGYDQEVLIAQNYSAEDDLAHIRHLLEYFADTRYIRLDGRPVFLVYQASALPDPMRTTDIWRTEATRAGVGELFLCRVEAHGPDRGDPRLLGFDAAVEFQPDVTVFPPRINLNKAGRAVRRVVRPESGYRWNHVYDYRDLVAASLAKPPTDYVRFRSVTPSFDNSSRRPKWATIFRDSSPDAFGDWTAKAVGSLTADNRALFFVNAWNEWAEGNHLEPDHRFGHRYLEALRDGIRDAVPKP